MTAGATRNVVSASVSGDSDTDTAGGDGAANGKLPGNSMELEVSGDSVVVDSVSAADDGIEWC